MADMEAMDAMGDDAPDNCGPSSNMMDDEPQDEDFRRKDSNSDMEDPIRASVMSSFSF